MDLESIFWKLTALQKEICAIQSHSQVKVFHVSLDSLTQKLLSLDVSVKPILRRWCMKIVNQCNSKISEISMFFEVLFETDFKMWNMICICN